MNYLVQVSWFSHRYSDNTQINIGGLEFTVSPGEKVALLGGNGSGKSTLLNHLTGMLKPNSGQVVVMGKNPHKHIKQLAHQLGIVLQSPEEQLLGPTVFDDVAFAPRNAGWAEELVTQAVNNTLAQLGISHLAKKIPHYLSGGEQQKVALAGALVMCPKLLILDEPFSRLDMKSKKNLVQLLNNINHQNKTAILVTVHDASCLADLADTVYVMNQGQLVAKDAPETILTDKKMLEDAGLEPPAIVQLIDQLQREKIDVTGTMSFKKLAREISKKMAAADSIDMLK